VGKIKTHLNFAVKFMIFVTADVPSIKIIETALDELQGFQVWKPIQIKVRYSLSGLM
jgi:hypothetical protein